MKTKCLLLATSLLPALLLSACKKSSEAGAPPAGGDVRPSAGGNASATDEVGLKIRWQPGRRHVQRMELTQSSETRIPGAPKPIRQDTTMAQDYSILVLAESADGGCELELEFQDTEISVTSGGKEVMSLDTRGEALGDARDPMTKVFRSLVGTKLRFALDAKNQVQKVEGVKEFTAKLASPGRGATQSMMAGMFNEDYFKQMVAVGDGFPEKPVKPGDSWPYKRNISMGPLGSITVDSTYAFKLWEQREGRRCARLEYTGTLSSKGSANAGIPGGSMAIESGTSAGTVWYDPAEGMVRESDINQKLSVQISMNRPAGSPGGASGPQTFTTDLTQKINVKIGQEGK